MSELPPPVSEATASTAKVAGPDAHELLVQHGIDRAWLGEQLMVAGAAAADAQLDEIDASFIGTGQVGENLRCALAWSEPEAGPGSVVIKLPAVDETSRSAAAATETYVREVGFYRDVQSRVPIRTPVCFHASENRDANSFILVMEDLAPALTGDQLAGCTVEQAKLTVEQIAALHGTTWERREFLELDWLAPPSSERKAFVCDFARALWPGFAERYQGSLSNQELETGRQLVDQIDAVTADDDGPHCVVHGDFRLDNILFGAPPDSDRVTTVDWQTATWGRGAGDVAYFLSGALSPEVRRRNQTMLLDTYRTALEQHGPTVDAATIADHYRRGATSPYLMAIIASQLVGQTERGDAMFAAMARGAAHLMHDLDTLGAF